MAHDNYSFEQETTVKETSTRGGHELVNSDSGRKQKSSSEMKLQGKVPLIIAGVVGAGLLIALIVVSVFLGQKTSESKDLKRELDARSAATTVHPGGSNGTTAAPLAPDQTTATVDQVTVAPPSTLPEGELRLRDQAKVKPLRYELALQVNVPYDDDDPIPAKWTTKGTVSIIVVVGEDNVNSILLHARHEVPEGSTSSHLKRFKTVTVTKVSDGKAIAVTSVAYNQKDNVVVTLASAMEKSPSAAQPTEYVLKIEFEGYVGDDNQGLYRSQYIKGTDQKPK